jgi:prepilin-type N-terminal cleavage/methylation domain-containing protein
MRAPRHHRGFTLLELLLVVALLLTAGALVYPAMVERMDDRAFESGAEIVVNQLLLARALARTTGDPIEVVYLPEPARVEARRFDPARGIDEEDGLLDAFRETDDTAEPPAPPAGADEAADLAVPEDWAIRVLPANMWIDTGSADDNVRLSGPGLFRADPAEERGTRPVRLTVFLPDGSALAAEAVFVRDDDDRNGRLTVNPWTGLPAFERGAGAPDEEIEEEEEEPEDDEEEIEGFDAETPAPEPEPEAEDEIAEPDQPDQPEEPEEEPEEP